MFKNCAIPNRISVDNACVCACHNADRLHTRHHTARAPLKYHYGLSWASYSWSFTYTPANSRIIEQCVCVFTRGALWNTNGSVRAHRTALGFNARARKNRKRIRWNTPNTNTHTDNETAKKAHMRKRARWLAT